MYAFHDDATDHPAFRDWLSATVSSSETLAVSDVVLGSVLRITTNPRIFSRPAPISAALAFAKTLRDEPNSVGVAPGDRHWQIFSNLCIDVGAKGNIVPDAWLAALAIESGSELITTDRDFSRFPGLRWRHPLA